MKIQVSKRIMCCLLSALLLFCTVVQPIEASATSLGLAAGATVVGISTELAVSAMLTALGVSYLASGDFEELVTNISQSIPSEYIIETMSGTEMLEGISYNDVCYVYQDCVEWVNNYLYAPTDGTESALSASDYTLGGVYQDIYDAVYYALSYDDPAGKSELDNFDYSYCYTYTAGSTSGVLYTCQPVKMKNASSKGRISVYGPYWELAQNFDTDVITWGGLVNCPDDSGYSLVFDDPVTSFGLASASSIETNAYSVTLSDRISTLLDGETYTSWLAKALTLSDTTTAVLPIVMGDTIAATGSIAQTIAQAGAIAPATTYEDTDEIVYVDVPDVSADLSGIIALLKAILQALNNIYQSCAVSIKSWIEASTTAIVSAVTSIADTLSTIVTHVISIAQSVVATIPGLLSDIVDAIVTGVTDITKTITDVIAEIIAKLLALGATLADILSAIQSLAITIADAIADALVYVFVPSADFITAKVESLRARFDWINPFIDFAKSLSFSGSEPPVIYIHLDAAEGSYYYGGTIPFLDMRWYARYKATGDAIISGFLWALFGWRMYLKLPGIINGAAGAIGHISH